MTFKVILAAAVLATSISSVTTTAAYSAQAGKPAAAGKFTTGEKRKVFGKPDGSYGGKNIASNFTKFCYSQFGPNAKWPDAALLQDCLSK